MPPTPRVSMTSYAPRRVPLDRGTSDLRQRHLELRLVLALLVAVRRVAGLVALEEEDLRDPLVGVNLRGNGRRIRDLERRRPLPFGLERRHVHDDAAPRVGGLAEADGQDVTRYAEVLDRAGERERVRRHDADVGLQIAERSRIECF